jgi:hypothetical protein
MQQRTFIALLACLSTLLSFAAAADIVGQPAPDFALRSMNATRC